MVNQNNLTIMNAGNAIIRNSQNQVNVLKNIYRGNDINSDEYKEMIAFQKLNQEEAAMAATYSVIEAANNQATLFAYMNDSVNIDYADDYINDDYNNQDEYWGSGIFVQDEFLANNTDSPASKGIQAINYAKNEIENRSNFLVEEIGYDKARGHDVSDKREALENLEDNLDILNEHLNNSIETTLQDYLDNNDYLVADNTQQQTSSVTHNVFNEDRAEQFSIKFPKVFERSVSEIAAQISRNEVLLYGESVATSQWNENFYTK